MGHDKCEMTAVPGYCKVTPERCEQTGLFKTRRTQASGCYLLPQGCPWVGVGVCLEAVHRGVLRYSSRAELPMLGWFASTHQVSPLMAECVLCELGSQAEVIRRTTDEEVFEAVMLLLCFLTCVLESQVKLVPDSSPL